MLIVICNRESIEFVKNLLNDNHPLQPKIIHSLDQLKKELENGMNYEDVLLVEMALAWNKDDFLTGIDLVKWLRREKFMRNRIIFTGSEVANISDESDQSLLDSKASNAIPVKFTVEQLDKKISEIFPLDENELKTQVLNYCELTDYWDMLVHKIEGVLDKNQLNKEKLIELVEEFTGSVNFYAPQHKTISSRVRNMVSEKKALNKNNLLDQLQTLSDNLVGKINNDNWKDEFERLAKYPPKGYGKILIADDEPLPFLVNTLQTEFFYEVEQSYNFTDALNKLNKLKPSVVLSDYYFKKTKFDKPKKQVGEEFMKIAQTLEISPTEEPKKPIVAVISKVSLDPEKDFRQGILDCTGPKNATNPDYIHYKICREAERLGVKEFETVGGKEFSSEFRCRQRLMSILKELPRTMIEWNYFRETIKETLTDLKNVKSKKNSVDSQILESLIDTLSTYSKAKTLSLKQVEEIYTRIEEDHDKSRESEPSEANTQTRDILHGKIDQFYKIVIAIQTTRRIVSEVGEILVNTNEFAESGKALRKIVNDFDENEDILPYFSSLQKLIRETLQILPEFPVHPQKAQATTENLVKYKIISVEDHKIWQYSVEDAIKKLKKGLSGFAEIEYLPFDNSSEALAACEKIAESRVNDMSKTIAILDICLPEKKGLPPQRKNGLLLLEKLSAFKTNFPKFVFSTKTSIKDILELGKAGVPNHRFITKDHNSTDTIVARLAEIVQKEDKNFIRLKMDENDDEALEIYINGLHIKFPEMLKATFYALIELTSDSQADNSRFSPFDIYQKRPDKINKKQREKFENKNPDKIFDEEITIIKTINEIKEFILKSFHKNNLHFNYLNLIKTDIEPIGKKSFYRLNAEIEASAFEGISENEDETVQNEDEKTSFDVLVVHSDDQIREKIVEKLHKKTGVGEVKNFSRYKEKNLENFYPDIVCFELELVPKFVKIKEVLTKFKFGIIITVNGKEKNQKNLAQQINEMEVPFTNFIELYEKDWENNLLTKFENEIRRVFFGELAEAAKPTAEPAVEIKPESNLKEGIIRIKVNDLDFKMNHSHISKILGYLLLNPRKLVSLEIIKQQILGDNSPLTEYEGRGWARKLRNQIELKWFINKPERKEIMKILEFSAEGFILNVQIVESPND